MIFLLLNEIGIFLSGGGGYSPSGSYSVNIGTGLTFPFEDSTFGYMEFQTYRYKSLEILEYIEKNPDSEITIQSTKFITGFSMEFKILKKLLIKPGMYYIILSQLIKERFQEGGFIITAYTPLRKNGFGGRISLIIPFQERFRTSLSIKKEWGSTPSWEYEVNLRLNFL